MAAGWRRRGVSRRRRGAARGTPGRRASSAARSGRHPPPPGKSASATAGTRWKIRIESRGPLATDCKLHAARAAKVNMVPREDRSPRRDRLLDGHEDPPPEKSQRVDATDQLFVAHAEEEQDAVEHQVVGILADVLEAVDAQAGRGAQTIDVGPCVGRVDGRKRVLLVPRPRSDESHGHESGWERGARRACRSPTCWRSGTPACRLDEALVPALGKPLRDRRGARIRCAR